MKLYEHKVLNIQATYFLLNSHFLSRFNVKQIPCVRGNCALLFLQAYVPVGLTLPLPFRLVLLHSHVVDLVLGLL
jgi:hypothetical protein